MIRASDDNQESAIREGIRAVGTGRRGSKPLEPNQIKKILDQLRTGNVPAIVQGAFFGALVIKGVTSDERALGAIFAPGILENPQYLAEVLAEGAPLPIIILCARLLAGETLTEAEAEQLGDFLFSDQPGEGARGLAASILRVRYETPEEYAGLLASLQKTLDPSFRGPIPPGPDIIQLAEPFDGVDHSNLITPLIAQFIQRLNYRVVSLVGRNSGPKFGSNLFDLAKALHGKFLVGSHDLSQDPPSLGWYVTQRSLSRPMDQWVERRHQIIKRPFLATLERFINPFNARIMIASAFHPPYGEKMLTICERAGYLGGIVVRNGLEGSLAFPLMRDAKILCTARDQQGNYRRTELLISPEDVLGEKVAREEKLTDPSLEQNKEWIETYSRTGRTSYDLFDWRVKVTCQGLKKAIEWVETNMDVQE